jgi:hypothetical protein
MWLIGFGESEMHAISARLSQRYIHLTNLVNGRDGCGRVHGRCKRQTLYHLHMCWPIDEKFDNVSKHVFIGQALQIVDLLDPTQAHVHLRAGVHKKDSGAHHPTQLLSLPSSLSKSEATEIMHIDCRTTRSGSASDVTITWKLYARMAKVPGRALLFHFAKFITVL